MYGLNLIYYQNILSSKQTIMETHLDHEMRQCADQMMELQQKAIELQEQKKEHIHTETSKIRELEPNMEVMKDWLNYHTEQHEYYKTYYEHGQSRHWSHPSHPSQFMKEFIEATFNLFQIQQKKIEDLEAQVNSQ